MILVPILPGRTHGPSTASSAAALHDLAAALCSRRGLTPEPWPVHPSSDETLRLEGYASTAGGCRVLVQVVADTRAVTRDDVGAFVGMLLGEEPTTEGLLVNLGSPSESALDYAARVAPTLAGRATILLGRGALEEALAALGITAPDAVAADVARSDGRIAQFHALLLGAIPGGPQPVALVTVGRDADRQAPEWFALHDSHGRVADTAVLDSVRRAVPSLNDLVPLTGRSGTSLHPGVGRRQLTPGVLVGSGWADYRLPAAPQYFVGRSALLEGLVARLTAPEPSAASVLQVMSRSGVGKSSLMAVLAERLTTAGAHALLFDTRNTTTPFDVWTVVQALTGGDEPPNGPGEVETALAALAVTSSRPIVLLLDQFESTFASRAVFEAYLHIALTVRQLARGGASRQGLPRAPLHVVVARKNDVLARVDDIEVSLRDLNAAAESVTLEDFTVDEAVELIQLVNGDGKRVSGRIQQFVLEFARGFPWLLKRTMAHVVTLAGQDQGPGAIATGLRLEDLFNEELEELSAIDREYIVKLARHLPATYTHLETVFGEDPALPAVIGRLIDSRLLRSSGDIYDTYNDVFKEYLVYQRLPEFTPTILLRHRPGAALGTFTKLLDAGPVTAETVKVRLERALGTAFNAIRGLRDVGLLDRAGGDGQAASYIVPAAARAAFDRMRLGEYLRQQLAANGVVADLLARLREGPIPRQEVSAYLRDRLPFVQASDSTWDNYTTTLLAWLETLAFVGPSADPVALLDGDRDQVVRRLGNLRRVHVRGKRVDGGPFLPSTWWSRIPPAIDAAASGCLNLAHRKQQRVWNEVVALGLGTPDGDLVLDSAAATMEAIRARLAPSPYAEFWRMVEDGGLSTEIDPDAFQLDGLLPVSIASRGKILASWGRGLGYLTPGSRAELVSRAQRRARRR